MGNTQALIRNVGELVLDFGRKVPKGTNITYIWKINKRAILELTAFETHEPEDKVQIHIDWTPESYEVIVYRPRSTECEI